MPVKRRPPASHFPFLDHGGLLAFSHRGGTNEWPENTMPAFQYSIDIGYHYLETDVHLSADGVLYAFHDDNLRVRTGIDANFADIDAADIDRLLVDGRAKIPRLDEVLSTWPETRVNLDAKSDAAVRPLIRAIREHHAIDRVCVGSFSDRRVQLCRAELGPDLCTSMGQFEGVRLLLASWGLADPDHLHAACAQIPVKHWVTFATPRLVELAHENDIHVHVWTINDPAEMNRLIDLGVDGIMTDQPPLLRDVLIKRGRWSRHKEKVAI